MRIAFDVKGTLEGHYQDKVLRLFHAFQKMGHEMFVWSNSYQYAIGAISKYNLTAAACDKVTKYDAKTYGRKEMDIAVEDDRSQTEWLASCSFVLVNEIPDDVEEFAERLIKNYTKVDA